MDVNNLCLDSFFCQFRSCFQRRSYAKSVCNNGKVFSLAENNTFAKLKFIIRIIIDNRNSKTAKSHVNRTYMLISCLYHCFCFNIIRRACNNHSRNCTHKCKILAALVRSTILTNGNSAVGSTNLNIQLRISNRVANLLKSTSCSKHSKSTCERHFSSCCDSGSNSHHVALCNTAVDMTLRECFLKDSGLCSCSKVSVQNNQIIMFFSKFYESVTITCSGGNLLYF